MQHRFFLLIDKYNIPGPRYTSYPTVPYWDNEGTTHQEWIDSVIQSFEESNADEGIGIYIHLPFCESLCTFCACHKHITVRHEVEEPYIDTLLKEWRLYLKHFGTTPRIKELHLGGGTPTFFGADNLKRLVEGIAKDAAIIEDAILSFEAHPNKTSKEQLQTLYNLGFRRTSFGIQDYDKTVQIAINRIQSFENVKRIHQEAKEIGYESICHDIIFGLPHQTLESIQDTIQKTISLKPERIAFYSYAHVPWIKGIGQRGFDENDLPKEKLKRTLYEEGKRLFFEAGYVEIGMDHFALPHDGLYVASQKGLLHRNFMGYTAGSSKLTIGLGMSAISDSWYAFAQNEKSTAEYQKRITQGEFAIFRGHKLTDEDLIIRRHILNLMCNLTTSWEEDAMKFDTLPEVLRRLEPMVEDGVVTIEKDRITVDDEARMFVRNVCMAFDLRLARHKPDQRIFSMTI